MAEDIERADIVMLGTFGVWGLGSLQARALPLARAIHQQAQLRVAIVTTPWDAPGDAGAIDLIDGIPVINTAVTDPAKAPLAVRQQLRWLDRLRPRILHLFKPRGFGGLTAALIRRRKRDMRLLVDSDDWEGDGGWNERNDYSLLQRRIFAWQEQSLVAGADHVTAASHLLARRASRLRTRPDSVTLLPNGLQRRWIDQLRAARQSSQPGSAPPTILVYSRFAEFPKDWLVRFARSLGGQVDRRVRLSLVGNPGDMAIPETQTGIEIETHGFVARERLPELLAAATVAVYPYEDNLINRSKQSVKLLELMASGCPVIASDVGEIAATLGSGGRLVRGSNPDAFAQAFRELLDQPAQLAEMALQSQCRIDEHFEIGGLAARLATLYRELGVEQPC